MRDGTLSLDGNWTVAVRHELINDPEHAVGRDRDALEPQPPPDLTEAGWLAEQHEVPECWEDCGWSKRLEGPVWYIRSFSWEGRTGGAREGTVTLEFAGVSYFCHIWLNGTYLGSHRGIWTPFAIDAAAAINSGENTLAVEVFKPWRHHFPIETSLAGFIPYVTSTFGGIWKGVSVSERPSLRLDDVYAYPSEDLASILVEASIENTGSDLVDGRITARVSGSAASVAERVHAAPGDTIWQGEISAAGLDRWSPDHPALHRLDVTIEGAGESDTVALEIGLRRLEAEGRALRLNGEPIYVRGVLHWMSYVDSIAPHWRADAHESEIEYVRSLGFNMIKQCLVVPPDEYLSLSDRLGMLVWIELPMWMPKVDEEFRQRAIDEYTGIVRRLRSHPSVVMWTLGCELNADADGVFLTELFDTVKALVPGSPLLRDNSGSAEAYGGVELEISDYYDYHFYAEANQFPLLVDHFLPGWREEKPLIFGEYCDSDTLRNVDTLRQESGTDELWWASSDNDVNPQGVRWDMSVIEHGWKLPLLGLPCEWEQAIGKSRARTVSYRTQILEQTRLDPRIAGYVVTNIIDTPISTAGVLDISGRPKFDREDFIAVNDDAVLLMERDRRRIWARGGDRPLFLDRYNLAAEAEHRFRIIVSNYTNATLTGTIETRVVEDGRVGSPLVEQSVRASAAAGAVSQIDAVAFVPPRRAGVYRIALEATFTPDEESTHVKASIRNRWELWVFPTASHPLPGIHAPVFPGPIGEELADADNAGRSSESAQIVVKTCIDSAVLRRYRDGLSTCVIVSEHDPRYTIPSPFWREGVPLIATDSIFDDLPHSGYAGAPFLGVTPDLAMDPRKLDEIVGETGDCSLYRIDARTLGESSYWIEWGNDRPRLIVTTLRLLGGIGTEPIGVESNILGGFLLRQALERLRVM